MKKKHTFTILSILALFLLVFAVTATQKAVAATPEAQQEQKTNVKADDKSQTAGEYFDDSVITTAVKGNILGEKGLSSMEINVITKDGVVTLAGKTDTAEHSRLAESVTKKTDGVKRVVNNLQVDGQKPQTAGEYIDDSAVTTAVKADILKEKGLSSLNISVKTQDGIVTLTGTTDTAENSKLAEQVTGKVNGVKKVVNELKVTK